MLGPIGSGGHLAGNQIDQFVRAIQQVMILFKMPDCPLGFGQFELLQIFDEYSKNLSDAIKIILYSLDPEMIVLGGSVSKSYKFFKDSLWNNLRDYGYPQSLKKLKIEATELDNIAVLGAAALIMENG